MNIPCRISISAGGACAGVDEPFLNVSSEAPDTLLFTGIGWTQYTPYAPLGGGMFTVPMCFGVEFSATSQEEANLLASLNAIICGGAGVAPAVNGGTSVTPGTPVSNPNFPVYNRAQTATGACSSASTFTYTVPAGTFGLNANQSTAAAAQVAVDAHAMAYAQQRVSKYDYCLASTNNGNGNNQSLSVLACLGKVLGTTNLFVVPGASGTFNWTASGLPPGISLEPGTTVGVIDASGDEWVKVGGGIGGQWTNLTNGVTQQGQPAGTNSGNIGTADLLGIPTSPGNYGFTVTATATNGQTATTFSGTLSVLGFTNPTPVAPFTNPAPLSSNVCTLYTLALEAAGGTPPYTFAVDPSTSLPSGLTLAYGVLHGGVAAGTYNFNLLVTDSLQQQCSQACLLTVTPSATQPSITTPTALPNAHAGKSYSATISITGGCPAPTGPPYTLQVVSGSLPYAFQLGYSGGWAILGYPGLGQVGSYSFSLQATDWAGQTVIKPFTLTIDDNTVVNITCPGNPSIQASGSAAPGGGQDQNCLNSLASAAAFNNLSSAGCPLCSASVTSIPRTNSSTPSVNPDGNTFNGAGGCTISFYLKGYGANNETDVHALTGNLDLYSFIQSQQGGYPPNGVYVFSSSPHGNGTVYFTLYF